MPTHIKLILSAIVVLVAAFAGWWQLGLGHQGPGYVAWGLGAFMIFALWVFPEAKGQKQKGER
ncbi:hypothetical protein SAMN06265365_11851 [Tistlia consotensis]|uniref:Uncharacterized protein n=1 Tax=Tistlia consotensis USBA 355 TaxID=560819 RepID=A0A1Y6CA48_9PROT|nr:hypothetical protein [Tistlia consotensis]SMF53705.1 hypothetical protein SAMN05428998_11952 [Tistlia consotensis USBA 355]SNR85876.1 hypothetical protein SAMN06265365_11851 [Tistlia consotensis]